MLAGRYRVGRVIGSGAMGRVFAAEHVDLGRACAVKVINLPDGEHGDHDARDRQEAVARFRTEAFAASRMDHPNVLRVLDFGREPDGTHYLVTEQLDGVDLVDAISQEERIEPARAIRIVRQICSALQHAHDRGVVHRDIKPENVRLIRREGDDGRISEVVKVLDFGTAFLSDGAPAGRLVIGTPAYMSPEQASGGPVDARSDVYAVGVLMFELATGRLPFERSSAVALAAAHIECPPPAPSSLDERVSAQLEEIILWCLHKEPERRPQSCRELRDALDRLAGEQVTLEPERASDAGIRPELDEPPARARRVSRLRPRAFAALAAAAIGAMAAVGVRVAGPVAVESAAAAESPAVAAPTAAIPVPAEPPDVAAPEEAPSATPSDVSRPRRGERSPPRPPAFQARPRRREIASKNSQPQADPYYALASQAEGDEPPSRAAEPSPYEPEPVPAAKPSASVSAPTSSTPGRYAPEGI